jgi:hypothetical protein
LLLAGRTEDLLMAKIREGKMIVRVVSAASVAMLLVQPVQAAYNLTLTQDGPNVVATGSGTIDLTGLTFGFSASTSSGIDPPDESMITGAFGVVDAYGATTPPGDFGSGAGALANSGVGDLVGTYETTLYVPSGYQSGGALSDSAIYNGATYASLGVTPGTYVWTWGSGANADSLTLVIGAAGVPGTPEPSTWVMMLLGFGLLGYAGFRKHRRHVQ